MPLFSLRRNGARLTPELDDGELGKLVKMLRDSSAWGTIGAAELGAARVGGLLKRNPGDWDRRAHRVSVLAHVLSDSNLPVDWATREPNNVDALVLHAWAQLVRGRRQGGLGDAAAVLEACHRAAELNQHDPTPWVVLLGVYRLERYPRKDVFALWQEVLSRDRWHREAHLSMLEFLSPDEGGSHMHVLEFIDALRAQMPANAPCAAVELTAHVMQYHTVLDRGGMEALLARNHWSQPAVSQALDRAYDTWRKPGFFHHAAALADLNLLAYALITANRKQEATQVFQLLNGRVTHWPWRRDGDPVGEFRRWQERLGV